LGVKILKELEVPFQMIFFRSRLRERIARGTITVSVASENINCACEKING
jgi:hypothetical protein